MRLKLLPLLLLVTLTACEQARNYNSWDYREFHGKVSQVRILQAGDTIVKDDNHPGEVTRTHVEEVKACELWIRVDSDYQSVDHKFLVQNGELLAKCALSQPGDDAAIQYHWEHDQKSPNDPKNFFYSWQCESNETYSCSREELP